MRFRADGALTGLVGLGPLWSWPADVTSPRMLGIDGGAACWHEGRLLAVLSEPPVGIVSFGDAGSGYSVRDSRIPSDLQAEGSHWLASQAAPRKTWGVVNGVSIVADGLSVVGLGADGTYALAGEASGFCHVIHWASGPVTSLPYGVSVSRIRDGYAMVRAGNQVAVYHAGGMVAAQVIPGESWPIMPLVISGRLWLLYVHAEQGTVLHQAGDATKGTRLAGDRYGIDALVGDSLTLGWSTREGDRAGDARRQTLALDALQRDDLTPVVVIPPKPPAPPVEPLAIAITSYTDAGTAPLKVVADYHVTGEFIGATAAINGMTVAGGTARTGRFTFTVVKPGEYRLTATATGPNGTSATTGRLRLITVRPPLVVIPPPPPPPGPPAVKEGAEAYAQAAEESRDILARPARTVPTLTVSGRQFLADGRLWVPRMVSGLTLLVRTPAAQVAFLDWAVATGFNGVRVFAGALTWAGQTPETARAGLPGLLGRCAERGLVCEVTAITDSATGYDAFAHLAAVAEVVGERKGVLLELANEVGHHTQSSDITADRLKRWGDGLSLDIPWAIGAASVDEPAEGGYPTAGGTYSTAHLHRGRPTWNNVRRVREIYAIVEAHKSPAINNEPMGADEVDGSVSGKQRWNDPVLFFTLGALDRAFGVGGVHHSQAGLMAVIPGPVQQACAAAYVRGHVAVETALPGIVGSYRNVGHGGSPLSGATFTEGDGEGVVRAYSFISGGQGVTVLVGRRGDAGLRWADGWSQSAVLASVTGSDGRSCDVLSVRQ